MRKEEEAMLLILDTFSTSFSCQLFMPWLHSPQRFVIGTRECLSSIQRFDSFLRFLPLAVSHIVSHLDTRLRHRASVSEPKPKKAAEGTFAHFALFVQGVFALFDQGEIVAHA